MTLKIQDFIDIPQFQMLQDRLDEIYSFPSSIIDCDGNILTATAWQDLCTRFHRQNPESRIECIKSDQYIADHLHEANPAVSYRCPHGLIDNATPIIIDGVHYGNYFTGQFFLEPPDIDFFKEQAKRYGFDEGAYIEAVKTVPVWSREKLNSYLFFIKGLIEIITSIGLKNLKETEARKRIQETEDRQRTILDTTLDGFWITDRGGRFLEVNDAVCRKLGYSRPELLRMSISDIEAIDGPEEIEGKLQGIMREGSARFEGKHRCRDGTIRDMDVSVNYLPPPHDCCFAFLRDVTDRKKAEETIRQSEYKLSFLVKQTMFAVIEWDTEFRVREWNPAATAIFGYSREESVGRHATELIVPRSLKGDIEKVYGNLLSLEGGVRNTNENVTKDGRIILCEWFNTALTDENGTATGAISFALDITSRRHAEEEKAKLEAQLQQAMKMEAVGRLAGGVAHDFNNLLTVITGYSDLLLQNTAKGSPMQGELREIKRAGERAASLTQQLLAFSRKQIIEPKVVRLNLSVAEVHTMLSRLIGEDIELQAITGKSLGSVKIDPGQFQQILMNLAVNARDAMPGGGKVVIETENVELDEGYCVLHPYVAPGRFVMLSITDTGEGMSEEVKAQVFEPFFTTKERGSGTGLGLAMTYGVVRQAGGSIDVESCVGKGTTFRIYLPRVEEESVTPAKDISPPTFPGGTETVLLVEDEGSLRMLCGRILGDLGYRVIPACNGAEAIALAKAHGSSIDLLLTDVVMPGMNGKELSTRLLSCLPEMKTLYMSGYTDDAIVRHGVLDVGVSFIGKPYSREGLARKIREVLDGA
jgi:two-component system cell cycle sensor histidine kinase/response regulator CckA